MSVDALSFVICRRCMKLHLPFIKSRHRNTIAFILVYSLSLALYLHIYSSSSSSVQYEVIIAWGIVALVSAPFERAFATQLMSFPCVVWWEMQTKIAYTDSLGCHYLFIFLTE